jgi:uncharacterized protein (TIGR02996 family)
VTTEDDFQKALDRRPTDWQTRLVFADWLQERDDPRADGYRALAAQRLRPQRQSRYWWSNEAEKDWSAHGGYNLLPKDWFTRTTPSMDEEGVHCGFDTRREAEDAAALAFQKLPAKRRAELLGTKPKLKTKTKSGRKRKKGA